MPHIPSDRRELCLDLRNVTNWGELHFFFGQRIQDQFLTDPSYKNIRDIRRFFVQTAHRQEYFKKIRQALRCPLDDVLNEAALAWEIFEIEVVAPYEAVKAEQNGHAYEKSLRKIGELLKAEQAKKVNLVIPNQGAK